MEQKNLFFFESLASFSVTPVLNYLVVSMCGICRGEKAVHGPCQLDLLCFACITFQYLLESQHISLTVPAPNHLSPEFELFSLWLVFPAVVLLHMEERTAQIPPPIGFPALQSD